MKPNTQVSPSKITKTTAPFTQALQKRIRLPVRASNLWHSSTMLITEAHLTDTWHRGQAPSDPPDALSSCGLFVLHVSHHPSMVVHHIQSNTQHYQVHLQRLTGSYNLYNSLDNIKRECNLQPSLLQQDQQNWIWSLYLYSASNWNKDMTMH